MRSIHLLTIVAVLGAGSVAAAPPTGDPLIMDASPATYRNALRTGAAKDGIPSIDDPVFQDAAEADGFLQDGDRVIGIYRNGEARAYPQRILVWHEIVNDTIAGDPIGITYCPLTGTALGFHRGDAEFGVSGKLLNSNLVMYDRTTESRYPQILGTGISGEMEGKGLREVRLVFTDWGSWKARHPDTRVLSTDTGSMRNYQRDPYGNYNPMDGYYEPGSRRMFPVLNEDNRYTDKREILGFRDDNGAVAVNLGTLAEAGVIERRLNGEHYVIVHDPELETGWVFRGEADIDPDEIEFAPEGPRFEGRDRLEPVNAFRAMWFAWAAFYPDSEVVEDAAAAG